MYVCMYGRIFKIPCIGQNITNYGGKSVVGKVKPNVCVIRQRLLNNRLNQTAPASGIRQNEEYALLTLSK